MARPAILRGREIHTLKKIKKDASYVTQYCDLTGFPADIALQESCCCSNLLSLC